MPTHAIAAAKPTCRDGRKAGEQSAQIKAEDAGTTDIAFTTAPPWPAGNYTGDVP